MIKQKITLLVLVALFIAACSQQEKPEEMELYPKQELLIGTYTADSSKGIYQYEFDPNTGLLSELGIISGIENPSFLVARKGGHHFYSVGENQDGYVVAYAKDSLGKWQEQNRMPTMGAHPCHLTLDKSENWLFVANYSGGNLAVFKLNADGSLGGMTQEIKHTGSGPNKERQKSPHVHSVNISPDNQKLYVADLGTDEVVVYNFNSQNGQLVLGEKLKMEPGSGPRHLTFHPKKSLMYVINELTSTVSVVDVSRDSSVVKQTISTLPEGFDEESFCADVHISADGKYLYGSNRLHDTIVIFGVDNEGMLEQKSFHSTLGSFPRNFAIDPTGKFLLAANQKSNNIVVYDIDGETGAINPRREQLILPSPVCLEFIQ